MWYEEFGYKQNPLFVDPLKSKVDILGREQECEELLYRVSAGSLFLIEGKKGDGKTTLLKHIIDNFKGYGRVAYVDARQVSSDLNITEIIKNRPKNMILLLDNVDSLSRSNNERIRHFFDEDMILSVIFTTTDVKRSMFSEALKNRMSGTLKLKRIAKVHAIQAVQNRLQKTDILPDDIVSAVYDKTKTMIEFLEACDLLCRHVVQQKAAHAVKSDLKIIK